MTTPDGRGEGVRGMTRTPDTIFRWAWIDAEQRNARKTIRRGSLHAREGARTNGQLTPFDLLKGKVEGRAYTPLPKRPASWGVGGSTTLTHHSLTISSEGRQ